MTVAVSCGSINYTVFSYTVKVVQRLALAERRDTLSVESGTPITFGERLKQIRSEKHMTQRDTAKALGVTPASLSAYEKGNQLPSITVAIKAARFFNVSLDWLVGINDTLDPFDNVVNVEELLRSFLFIAKNESLALLHLPGETEGYEFSQLSINSDELDSFLERASNAIELYQSGTIDQMTYKTLIEAILHSAAQEVYLEVSRTRNQKEN